MSTVLVVGDLHAPATHPLYLNFCKTIARKHRTNEVVIIGDIIDNESISRHEKNPELPAAKEEFNSAMETVKQWYKAFPNAKICIGNHDERITKKARAEGIPSFYLRTYNDVYGTSRWKWDYEHNIDGVHYFHGTGWGGKTPAFNAANYLRMSVVSGHCHSIASIHFHNNGHDTIFGMNVGSGVDINHPALNYSKNNLKKSILSCGVVKNGQFPYLEIM